MAHAIAKGDRHLVLLHPYCIIIIVYHFHRTTRWNDYREENQTVAGTTFKRVNYKTNKLIKCNRFYNDR